MIKTGRKGRFNGKEYLFTHRNPKTGEVWSDEIKAGKDEYGKWVASEKVVWADAENT